MKTTISFRSLILCVALFGMGLAMVLVVIPISRNPALYMLTIPIFLAAIGGAVALSRCPYCGRRQNFFRLLRARSHRYACKGCGEQIIAE